jgi:lipooligosaccharide transport system permease protein
MTVSKTLEFTSPKTLFGLNWHLGIWPVALKIMKVEAQDWHLELLTTLDQPLTFFLIFGLGLRGSIGEVQGVPYPLFMFAALMAHTIMLQAYSVGAWGLWLDRWHQGMLDEARIKPVTTTDLILGHLLGGVVVALIKGVFTAISLGLLLWLIPSLPKPSFAWTDALACLLFVVPAAFLFAIWGSAVGLFFRKPDNIARTMTVVITPMLYLGGLFFPITSLPQWIQPVLKVLPTTLVFEGTRAALLQGEILWANSIALSLLALACLAGVVWLFNRTLID